MCLTANSRKDPTNTGRIRAQAIKELKRRRDGAGNELARFTQSLERYATRKVIEDGQVVNRVVYRYDLDPTIDTDAVIREIINRWFDTSGNKPNRYFFDQYVSAAYAQGSAIETKPHSCTGKQHRKPVTDAGRNDAAITGLSGRLRFWRAWAFEDMKDFSGDAGAPLRYYLTQAMAEGKGIRTIVAGMKKEWDKQRRITGLSE